MGCKLKKGDTVEVVTGESRGSRGRILNVDSQNRTVLVEGVNRVYKHVKPSRRNPQGGRLHVEMPIDISNVMIVSPKTDKPTRIRVLVNENGKKSRVDTEGNVIDVIRHA